MNIILASIAIVWGGTVLAVMGLYGAAVCIYARRDDRIRCTIHKTLPPQHLWWQDHANENQRHPLDWGNEA